MSTIVELEDALARYVVELSTSAAGTHRAEDRPRYESHLAAAARMFAALRRDSTLKEIKLIVADERRGYGWSYLSDHEGSRAEAAFDSFALLVEGA
jgi:hypothetical protein